MSNLKRLEDALRAEPYHLGLRAELVAELRASLGYSLEEATAHMNYVWIMANRARELATAGELLRISSPIRSGLIRAALAWVNLDSITRAAFHVVTDGEAPTVEDQPRTIAGEERTVVVRIPARWIIATHNAMIAPVTNLIRRPKGGE